MRRQVHRHLLKQLFFFERAPAELFVLEQSGIAVQGAKEVREAIAEPTAQIRRAPAAELFDIGAKRKLIDVASPIFDPAQVGAGLAVVGDSHLGEQHGIVAEGRDNGLVDGVAGARDLLAKVTDAEDAVEALCAARIERAQRFGAIGEVADAAAELASFGRIGVGAPKFLTAYSPPKWLRSGE